MLAFGDAALRFTSCDRPSVSTPRLGYGHAAGTIGSWCELFRRLEKPSSEWYNKDMELVARPARAGLPAYWVRSMADALLGVGPGRGKSETYAPAVVLISSSGEEWVLQRPGSYRQAQAACTRFEKQRQAIGDAAFCRALGVPDRLAKLWPGWWVLITSG